MKKVFMNGALRVKTLVGEGFLPKCAKRKSQKMLPVVKLVEKHTTNIKTVFFKEILHIFMYLILNRECYKYD